jgi:hypothetical protein
MLSATATASITDSICQILVDAPGPRIAVLAGVFVLHVTPVTV